MKFAFIIHPLSIEDMARKFPSLGRLPGRWVERMIRPLPAITVSEITGLRSATGVEAAGWFMGCLLTSRQMVDLPEKFVLNKIISTAQKAEEKGAEIVGLGAYTSVVGDAGVTIAQNVGIPVTTGNSYTVATAIEGIQWSAQRMGIDLKQESLAVVGATGSIGKAAARIMAQQMGEVVLVGRQREKLEALAEELGPNTRVSVNPKEVLPHTRVVITVTSAVDAVIEPEDLMPGALVCDVARPRDVSVQVAKKRDDCLVFEGGVVAVPGDVNFNFSFGFPPKTSYACMAETMILALEERRENFSIGRDLSVERIQEISRLARKHGFGLAGLRSFERAVDEAQLAIIQEKAEMRRRDKRWVSAGR